MGACPTGGSDNGRKVNVDAARASTPARKPGLRCWFETRPVEVQGRGRKDVQAQLSASRPWWDGGRPACLRRHLSFLSLSVCLGAPSLAGLWLLSGPPLGQQCCEHMLSVLEGFCHRPRRHAAEPVAPGLPRPPLSAWTGQHWPGGRSSKMTERCGDSTVMDRHSWGSVRAPRGGVWGSLLE